VTHAENDGSHIDRYRASVPEAAAPEAEEEDFDKIQVRLVPLHMLMHFAGVA